MYYTVMSSSFNMLQGKFEGDLSQLSPKQLEFISKVIIEKGFQDGKVFVAPVGNVGDNYIANVIRITAEKDGESFKIIAKVAPKLEHLRMTMNARMAFLNESAMYTEILPKFTKIEIEAGIPENERLKYAACYGCLLDDCDELVLLEDLTVSGYIMLDRFKPLTDVEIRLILESFARLHSLSYVLKYREPEEYNSLKNKLNDFWSKVEMMESMKTFFEMTVSDIGTILDTKYSDLIKNIGRDFTDVSSELRNFDIESRFSVIQQGDPWTNNILFKLEQEKAVSCCMIDYQISRVNSPVGDLQYMIFNCSDHETRTKHFLDWIDYYHNKLKERLQEFGLKDNNVYPREQLDADLKRHGRLSLGVSMLLASSIYREAAAAQELKSAIEKSSPENFLDNMAETSISSSDDKTVSIVKARVEGVIETCLQFEMI